MVQVYDVGRAINPTLVEGQIEGGAIMGLGLGADSRTATRTTPRSSTAAGSSAPTSGRRCSDLPELDNVIIENPSVDGPFGAKAIGEMANNAQPPAIANAIHDAVGVWLTEMPATPDRVLAAARRRSGEPRRDGKRVDLRRAHLDQDRVVERRRGVLRRRCLSRARTRGPSAPGTAATRGSSSTACGCTRSAASRCCCAACSYAPGKQVPWHKHDDTEQVMFILEGEVEMTIEDETTTLRAGDVVVVNRGLHHKLHSEHGVTFMEALAPVPLDHVPDRALDLVLGPDGGAQHVER